MVLNLIEVVQHTGDVWRPSDVHKLIGPKTFVIIGVQTMPNLFNNNKTMKHNFLMCKQEQCIVRLARTTQFSVDV